MPDTWTVLGEIPNCDTCNQDPPAKAYADARFRGTTWAYVCTTCFHDHGLTLGLGRGQELLLKPPDAPTTA